MDPTPDDDNRNPASRPEGQPRPYPVVLHLDGAACLVVGAGPVAARRARGLLEAGAAVTVVAPVIGDGVLALTGAGPRSCGSLTVEVRRYASPEASGFGLVVTATGDPDVDDTVAADALAGGALVNRADPAGRGAGGGAPATGTVLLPAVHRDGPVTVAVSTDGTGPALARWIRDRVAAGLDGTDVAALAGLVGEARAELLAPGRRGTPFDWPDALDRVAPLVAAGRVDEARALLHDLVATAQGGTPPQGRQRR
jgi:siroheme synthase-like protein